MPDGLRFLGFMRRAPNDSVWVNDAANRALAKQIFGLSDEQAAKMVFDEFHDLPGVFMSENLLKCYLSDRPLR